MTISFKPICFDSLGAKSACVQVKTPDISILLEPGISIMHKSFPGTDEQKEQWYQEGYQRIKEAMDDSKVFIISHYHFDHFIHDDMTCYKNKILLLKNPNEYINDTQRVRAEDFFNNIYSHFQISNKQDAHKTENSYGDPLKDIPMAIKKDYGDYAERKKELLIKGRKWFDARVGRWNKSNTIPELNEKDIKIYFPEGRFFSFGDTSIYCSLPLFHGIEFARVGWIFSTIIKYKDQTYVHTSDVCGPMIEDYADFIINQNPNVVFLDGPMTYMFGYMLTKINLDRCIQNAVRIVREVDSDIIIYDHHLCRDKRFIERTQPVWDEAKKKGVDLLTAAEYLGKMPVVLEN